MLDWDDRFDYKKWFEKVKNMSEEEKNKYIEAYEKEKKQTQQETD